MKKSYHIPSYQQAVALCQYVDSPFYETKIEVNGFGVSIFNYRLAQYSDFNAPIFEQPKLKGFEMRGLTFVFHKDGSLYNRYVLLEKFFNLNQVPDSMYSVVKDYKIRYVNGKEDGSIATFIKLPNGEILGKSKMGFDNTQANGINRIYKTNPDVSAFVNFCLDGDIVPIFEYVSPQNRIVLRYPKEELILLRLRDNKTGKHIDVKDHLDKIGSIKIALFEDGCTLEDLIEKSKSEVDKEGWVVQFENGQMIKIKTDWYRNLHSIYTNDIYREHIIIGYILDDVIDDVVSQIPEDEKETHLRIQKIISIVKKTLKDKVDEIQLTYQEYVDSGLSKKDYASGNKTNSNFRFVMNMDKAQKLKSMSKEEILDIYDDMESYKSSLKRCQPYEMAVEWLRDKTKRLEIARGWLKSKDSTLFFREPQDFEEDN